MRSTAILTGTLISLLLDDVILRSIQVVNICSLQKNRLMYLLAEPTLNWIEPISY